MKMKRSNISTNPGRHSRLAALLLLLGATLSLGAGKDKAAPKDGQVFYFEPASIKYIDCDIEFRDPAGKKWPQFFTGRPTGGTYTFDHAKPQAQFAVNFDTPAQKNGDQSRRVLGDLFAPDKPPAVEWTVQGMSPFRTEIVETRDRKGATVQKEQELAELTATLNVGGHKVSLTPKATFAYHPNKEGQIERVTIETRFTVEAGKLGLTSMPAEAPIAVRITVNGSPSKQAPGRKRN